MKVDVIEMGNINIDELKEKILYFENVDCMYSSHNVITAILPTSCLTVPYTVL